MFTDSQPTIFIPFHLPWNRPADYQRQTCLVLGQHYPVFCVAEQEPITLFTILVSWLQHTQQHQMLRRIKTANPTTLYWLRPLQLLPLQRVRSIKALNTAISIWLINGWWNWLHQNKTIHSDLTNQHEQTLPAFQFHQSIIWIFDPQFVSLLSWLNSWISIYDCVDYHRSAAPVGLKKRVAQWERQLINRVDIFSVNSHALYDIHQRQRKPDLLTVQGFAINEYHTATHHQRSIKCDNNQPPIIGFIGAINNRIDYCLLQTVARKHPNWQFVLQGAIETEPTSNSSWKQQLDALLQMPNVVHQPAVDRTQLLAVLQHWTVGIIPYQSKQLFNQYCFPMKLFEYFYAGLPVVSTPIDELQHYSQFVQIAASATEFLQAIEHCLAEPLSPQHKTEMRKLAISHRYEHKIRTIVEFANTHYNELQR